MKSTFILVIALITIISCSENQTLISEKEVKFQQDLEIRAEHDYFSELVFDSIQSWQSLGVLNQDKVDVMWYTILEELAKRKKSDIQSVEEHFSRLQINSDNWINIKLEKYNLLSDVQKEFIDEINNVFMRNRFESDSELILAFEGMKRTWNARLNSSVVYNTVEVAKSSYPFWRKNFKYIDNSLLRETCWEAIAKLGTGDATGGLWGSLGGPGGALLGAVGGTLGTTIQGAIWGFGCD